jgi:hypothetical protein
MKADREVDNEGHADEVSYWNEYSIKNSLEASLDATWQKIGYILSI